MSGYFAARYWRARYWASRMLSGIAGVLEAPFGAMATTPEVYGEMTIAPEIRGTMEVSYGE